MKNIRIIATAFIILLNGIAALANENAFSTVVYYTFTNGAYHLIGTSYDPARCFATFDTNCVYTVVIVSSTTPIPAASFTSFTKPPNYSAPLGNGVARHYER